MKSPKKIIAYVLLAIAIIYIICLVLFKIAVNPATLSSAINTAFQDKLGQPVQVKGKIDLEVFPWPGITMKDAEVSNPSALKQAKLPPLFQAHEVGIYVSFWRLFRGDVLVKKIVLESPTINLVTTPSSKQNWQPASKKIAEHDKKGSTSAPSIAVQELIINNATVNWINESADRLMQLTNLNLFAQMENAHQLNFHCDWKMHRNQPQFSFEGIADGVLNYQLQANQFQLPKFSFSGQFQYKNTPVQKINLTAAADLNLHNQTLQLTKLQGKIANYTIIANAIGKQLNSAPVYSGNISIKNGVIQQRTASFNWQASPKFIKLRNINAEMGDTFVSGNLNFNQFNQKSLDARLNFQNLHYQPKLKHSKIKLDVTKAAWQTHLSTKGATMKAMLANLSGRGALNAQGIKLSGLNVPAYVQALFKRLGVKFSTKGKATADLFQTGRFNYQIQSGVANPSKLDLEGKHSFIRGSGKINLAQQTLNYNVILKDQRLGDIALSVDVSGPMDNPKIRPDVSNLRLLLYNKNTNKAVGNVMDSIKNIFH